MYLQDFEFAIALTGLLPSILWTFPKVIVIFRDNANIINYICFLNFSCPNLKHLDFPACTQVFWGFPGSSAGKESPAMQEIPV